MARHIAQTWAGHKTSRRARQVHKSTWCPLVHQSLLLRPCERTIRLTKIPGATFHRLKLYFYLSRVLYTTLGHKIDWSGASYAARLEVGPPFSTHVRVPARSVRFSFVGKHGWQLKLSRKAKPTAISEPSVYDLLRTAGPNTGAWYSRILARANHCSLEPSSMQVSPKQLASTLCRILTRAPTYVPRRLNSTRVSSLLHNSLGIRLPPGKPIILPGDVGLAYNDLLATLRTEIDSKNPAGVWSAFLRLQGAGHANYLGLSDLEEVDTAIAPTVFRLVSKQLPDPLRSASHTKQTSSLPRNQLVAPIEQIHELALWLAVRGQICVLRASMIRALRESNPDIVLDLWRAYAKRCLAGEGEQLLETMARSDASSASSMPKPRDDRALVDPPESAVPPRPDVLKYSPGRPELLALTICAHAMLNDFRGAFDVVYPTLIPLKFETTRDLLEPIREVREDVVAETLRYVIDLDLLRMLARPWSFRNYLFKFVDSLDADQVQNTYAEIIRLLREPEPWIGPLDVSPSAPSVSSDPNTKPIFSVSRQTWCDLIEASDVLRQPRLKQSIWEDFHSLGATPTTGMWNTLMLGYVRAGDMERARKIWEMVGKDGRDVYTYTAMIQGLFERHRPSDANLALMYFDEMKKTISKEDISIRPYNIFIHGLLSNGRIEAALELVSQLEANAASSTPSGAVPDISTYNTVLRHYSRRRDLASLSKVLRSIANSGLAPDIYTFSTVLDALLAVGVKEAPARILEIMKALNVSPNAAIVAELIEHVVYPVSGREFRPRDKGSQQTNPRAMPRATSQSQDGPSPRERLQTGVKMLVAFEDAGVKTNVINYTSLMAAFHRAAGAGIGPQSVSHTEAQQAIQILRERMQKRNIRENRVTYNILIAACLEGGNVPSSQWRDLPDSRQGANAGARSPVDFNNVPPNVVQAVRYFHELRGAKLLPNHDTWYILLSGVASHGQIALARALCDELVETKFLPQTGLLRLIMKIRGGH